MDALLRPLIQRLVQAVRRDPGYVLDPAVPMTALLAEVAWRGKCLIRAQLDLAGVRGGRVRFSEGCHVRHRRYLTIGKGSVIEYGVRLSCLGSEGVRIGERVTVGKYALIECTSVLWHMGRGCSVGDGSSIGDFAFIGCAGGVSIGRNVLMGQRVAFHSQNHVFDSTAAAIKQQGVTDQSIHVGDDCWLGSGAILLAGVELGEGCVVAAGSVVTRSFPAGSVIAGVPAKLMKSRAEALH